MKKLKTISYAVAFLGFALTFSNCGDDEPVATFSYTINGDKKKVSSKTGVLQTNTEYDHEGRALYLTAANGLTQMLSVAVANWDFQNPPNNGIIEETYDATFDYESSEENNPNATCLELTGSNAGVTLCEGGLLTYITDNDIYYSAFDGNTNTTITITSCNTSKHTVSGTFSGKLQNFDEVELTIEGSFKNVRYIVQ